MVEVDEARIRELEEGDAWDEADEPVQLEVAEKIEIMVPVGLSSASWHELLEEARSRQLGPNALAKVWIEECLEQRRSASTGAGARGER